MDFNVLKDITYGMYVASTMFEGKRVGCVINTLMQVTSVDPIFAICVNKDNYTNKALRSSKKVGVSIMKEDTPLDIISKFGYNSSVDIDKFEEFETKEVSGIPVVVQAVSSYLIGDIINIVDCESHDMFLFRLKDCQKLNEGNSMTYKYYQEELKGNAPAKAPTFIKEESSKTDKKYKCPICGYVYDGDEDFSGLPDDYRCPICGALKKMFKEL